MASSRTHYDKKTKDHVVSMVRDRKMTIEEACKEYKCQPYQVLAWIGDAVLRDGEGPPQKSPALRPVPAVVPSLPSSAEGDMIRSLYAVDPSSSIDPGLARAVGEWWLRVRLPERLREEAARLASNGNSHK